MEKLKKPLPKERLFANKFKIIIVFILILFLVSLIRIHNIMKDEGYLSVKKYKNLDLVRSESVIKASDGKILAMDNKNRDFYINRKYVDLEKLDLFFAILENNTRLELSKEDKAKIRMDFKRRDRVLIKKGMDKSLVSDVKSVVRLLKKVEFLKYFTTKTGKKYLYGPEFTGSTDSRRLYSKNNYYYQPFLGFVNNENKGVFGIEKYVDRYTESTLDVVEMARNGVKLYSKEEVVGGREKEDVVVELTLDNNFQKKLKEIIEKAGEKSGAENILVSVVEVSTGEVKGLSQLRGFDANNIQRDDNKNMKDFYTNYLYEVGSVIKPITLSIAIKNKLVQSLDEEIDTSNGYMYIGKKRITDEHRAKSMTVKEVIGQSSNVGISRIALRMENNEFYEGLVEYGVFGGSDLETVSNKQYYFPERLKQALSANKKIQRATSSYGYGFMLTAYNLQRMYNVIFNEGVYLDFNIVKTAEKKKVRHTWYTPDVLKKTKEALLNVVEEGTGKAAKMKGFEIYGKTGTSHIASKTGKYENQYHATFIGAVEDKNGKKYNILVSVVKPSRHYRFASLSAVPIFKEVVRELFFQNKIKIKF